MNDTISNNNFGNNSIIREKSVVDKLLSCDIPVRKSKRKINDEDFSVPDINEYSSIVDINYNMQQLKRICRSYTIKLNGNKDILKKRIYNYMYHSYYCLIIQKIWRRVLVKNYIDLHGPGFKKRDDCSNDCDFISLDNIKEIPYNQFFSYKDDEDYIYGFDIGSLYNLYVKNFENKSKIENPFTRKVIDTSNLYNMLRFIRYSRILGIDVNVNYDELNELSESKKFEMKVLSLFQAMDSLGNYTNMNWFMSLNKYELVRFVRELADIWHYRANLTQETKREICPPNGTPFRASHISLHLIQNYSFSLIRRNILAILNELINKGVNRDARALGSMYVLSCLTLVNASAAECMPWLFESVNYV